MQPMKGHELAELLMTLWVVIFVVAVLLGVHPLPALFGSVAFVACIGLLTALQEWWLKRRGRQ